MPHRPLSAACATGKVRSAKACVRKARAAIGPVKPVKDVVPAKDRSSVQDAMGAIAHRAPSGRKAPNRGHHTHLPTVRTSSSVITTVLFSHASDPSNTAVVHRPTFGGTDRKQEQWPSTDWTNPWTPK